MVREARPEDAEAIARVHTRSWQKGYAHVFPAEALAEISVEGRRTYWKRHLGARVTRSAVVVAEIEGGVAGFASTGEARGEGEDIGELYAIYVEPEHWGTGLGRALIGEAERRLSAAGFAEAMLWVLDDNPRARRFYEAAGWTHDGGSKRDMFLGTEVTEVRYRKRLG